MIIVWCGVLLLLPPGVVLFSILYGNKRRRTNKLQEKLLAQTRMLSDQATTSFVTAINAMQTTNALLYERWEADDQSSRPTE